MKDDLFRSGHVFDLRSNLSISLCVKSICRLMFESVLNACRPKEVPFNFLPFTFNEAVEAGKNYEMCML